MSIINLFRTHKHYWAMPRKRPGGENIQICYGCGKEHTVTIRFDSQKSDAGSEAMVMDALYQPLALEIIAASPIRYQ